jgi:kynurenine formamidase
MSKFTDLIKDYNLVDLSHTLEESMPRPQVPYGHIPWKDHEKGDSFNTFMILVFEHAGTHVDAPIHLGGVEGPTIDEIPLSRWMGDAYVLDMTHKKENEYVTIDEVEQWESKYGVIPEESVVLFNFGWYKNWTNNYGVENQIYLKNNPGIDEDVAKYLASKKTKIVGGDIPTIDSDADPLEKAHRILLPAGVLIIENLANLDSLPPLGSFLIATPLKIKEGTGCPVRAFAFTPKKK